MEHTKERNLKKAIIIECTTMKISNKILYKIIAFERTECNN